jgi:urease accessory protein
VRKYLLPLAALALALPHAAAAHTFGAHGFGFAQGFAHPFSGWDHLLAMAAVGIWASQLGGRALWLVPSSFVGGMTLGALLGALSGGGVLAEAGVALSVVALVALVGLAVRLPVLVAMSLTAAFGLVHGFAHGAEMPEAAAPVLYGLGAIGASAILHAGGVAAGVLMRRVPAFRARPGA